MSETSPALISRILPGPAPPPVGPRPPRSAGRRAGGKARADGFAINGRPAAFASYGRPSSGRARAAEYRAVVLAVAVAARDELPPRPRPSEKDTPLGVEGRIRLQKNKTECVKS
jgi:hypothetical protein